MIRYTEDMDWKDAVAKLNKDYENIQDLGCILKGADKRLEALESHEKTHREKLLELTGEVSGHDERLDALEGKYLKLS